MANTSILAAFERMWQHVVAATSGKSDINHTHDDIYYTEAEMDSKLDTVNASISNITSGSVSVAKANEAVRAISADEAVHATSADNATRANNAAQATKDASGNVITDTYETKADSQTKLDSAKSYTDTKISGLASNSTVDNKISTHNTSTSAHSDIRDLITGLTTRLNALADSDDTTLDQMSEVVAYIKSNKELIESITTSKINVSDIVNNLTTNSTSKVLSAAQGVAIKALIDALETELDSHTHDGRYYTESEIDTKLSGKANTSHGNHVPATETANNAKFLRNDNTWQTVTPANIGAAASSHGTHVSYSSTVPVMDGTASVGTASTVSRSDHKHPTDTSRASKTEFDSHTGNTTAHITSTERTNWNTAKTHADSAHAPSNAEKNQNAFSNIKVGDTTVAADTTTDTLTLVGSNVTLTPDATNDKVTIGITKQNVTDALGYTPPTTDTKYTHPTTSGNKHIPSGGSSGQILRWSADGTAAWGNDNNTTYGVATSSALGLVKSGTDITVDSSGNVSVNDGSHNHAASNITSGTLAVARGGTGVTSNPSMLTNLGSTSAASVFTTSPRPGVTGTLPIANGGTGATTAANARTALDVPSNSRLGGLSFVKLTQAEYNALTTKDANTIYFTT